MAYLLLLEVGVGHEVLLHMVHQCTGSGLRLLGPVTLAVTAAAAVFVGTATALLHGLLTNQHTAVAPNQSRSS